LHNQSLKSPNKVLVAELNDFRFIPMYNIRAGNSNFWTCINVIWPTAEKRPDIDPRRLALKVLTFRQLLISHLNVSFLALSWARNKETEVKTSVLMIQ
jgi:hypothetical protein